MNRLSSLSFWQLSVISGLLIGLAYPPLPFGFFAWFGIVPLLILFQQASAGQGFRFGFLASITANLISLYWIGFNSGAGFVVVLLSLIGAVLYLAIFWGIFGFILTWVLKNSRIGIICAPLLWVIMEYLRSIGPLGFPWVDLALTQTNYLPLIQLAEVTGPSGIAFWIITLNICFLVFLDQTSNRKRSASIILILIFIVSFYGYQRINSVEASINPDISVVVTQPNINPNDKWDRSNRKQVFSTMHSLLDSAITLQPDLILWPESAVPAILRTSIVSRRPYHEKVISSNIPLLAGTVDRITDDQGNRHYFNGSIFLNTDNSVNMYHKIHLVPFAEYIPLSEKFPKLKELNFGQGNFLPGKEFTLFNLDSVKFSNIICYESSIPNLVRKFVKMGAQFLTIESNDGWLGSTSGPYQHFALCKLRAIENRIAIARSANTGISGVIFPSGKVVEKIPLGEKNIIFSHLPLSGKLSFYTKFGNYFAWICTAVMLIFIGITWINRNS
ncbi:apolipoprotein N-acyltransferase [Candidatus Neomarinimicrobiota bacterium]